MELKEMAKWFVLLVTSGVVTAVAIQFVTKYTQTQAQLAARAELEQLMLATAKAQTLQQQVPPQSPQQSPPGNTYFA